jgi:uncharacterized membrane protein YqjE
VVVAVAVAAAAVVVVVVVVARIFCGHSLEKSHRRGGLTWGLLT